jgi:hypothetical protein
MNIDATHALEAGGYLPLRARGVVDDPAIAAPRKSRPTAGRVVEGEVLGRQSERTGASAETFARRLRMQVAGAAASGPYTDARNRDALAIYACVAVAQGRRAPDYRLDLYA